MIIWGGLLAAFIAFTLTNWCNAQELPQIAPSFTQNGSCPSAIPDMNLEDIREKAIPILHNRYGPEGGTCGGPGWRQVASVDMAKANSACPTGWTKITTPITACTRGSNPTVSATFSTGDQSYSRVCGRVIAYQVGATDAFGNAILGSLGSIDSAYIDGLSLTHGPSTSRQHIWSFAAALSETATTDIPRLCPCSVNDFPYKIPAFVGSNYFCDSGNVGPSVTDYTFYNNKALWNGQGCASTSRCCQYNNPPWFHAALIQPTSDDLELRILCNSIGAEDIYVTIVELYMKDK